MNKTNEIEYDQTLTQFLIDNGFDKGEMVPLIPFSGSCANVGPDSEMMSYIDELKAEYTTGCIFTLPAKGFFPNDPERANWITVFYTTISSDEIRRRVILKAFL